MLETNTEDLPFLVDSVTGALHTSDLKIMRLLHPIVGLERDDAGRIVRVLHPREATMRESVMHFELDRRLDDAQLDELASSVRSVLGDVRRAVLDFPAMADRGRRMVQLASAGAARYADDEVDETVAFLEWLLQDHFIFLGFREYRIEEDTLGVVPGSGLGILADEASSAYARPRPLADLPDEVRERALEGDLLIVSKTNRLSTVHRRTRMDYVGVRKIGPDGRVTGEARMLGLFTSKAYAEPASQTPLLNRKLRQILRHEDLIEGSHDYKTAVALFDSFPKDELFSARTDDLRRAVVALLSLEGDRVRLLGRRSPDGRAVSLIAALPADRYDPELVEKLEALLCKRFGSGSVETHTVLGESEQVRIHATVHGPEGVPDVPLAELERELIALTRTWEDELRDQLIAAEGPTRGAELAVHWGPRFPEYYRASQAPALAVADVRCFDRLEREGLPFLVGLQNEDGPHARRDLQAGREGRAGRRDADARGPRPARRGGGADAAAAAATARPGCRTSACSAPTARRSTSRRSGERVADCITAVRRGDTESDTLNRLVLVAGLDWRQINVLRAYRMYRQRIGSRFTQGYQNDVLAANAGVTAKLVRYFEARFDPARPRDEAAEQALRDEIIADLDAVASLDHDRILRNQLGLIDATLRTNAYKPGREVIAFKLQLGRRARDPAARAAVRDLRLLARDGGHPPARRQGRPRRAALVGPPGLPHRGLRADARAGDQERRDRARGREGRLLPQGPAGRPRRAQGRGRAPVRPLRRRPARAHRQPRRGRGRPPRARARARRGRHVPRRRRRQGHGDVLRHGERGLGAARLLARRRVRVGRLDGLRPQGARDHRARRLGVGQAPLLRARPRRRRPSRSPSSASATCPATCSATGCCCSEQIRLVAAYDHRHVFIDPDPDAATGYAERKRLFELPGSSWDDYDRDEALRGRRRVRRAPPSRSRSRRRRARRSAIEDERLTPNDVIRAILRAPVDLLWNGGIGTVVKASDETDADAKDRASDSIRVDARDLRCRVIGEGGNLGLTHRARVEFAARGRARQRRLHRQLGRRRLLRPRGQPQDPARARRAPRRARPAGPRRAAARGHRRRRRRTCSTTRSCRRRSSPRRSPSRPRGCTPTRT